MTLAGSIAATQGHPFLYLVVLSVIAAAGKTLGAILLYLLSDKVEDLVLSKVGRYVGISHDEVEAFGKRFRGTWRDYLTLFIIRATPIIPSAPISLISGFVSLPKKMFVITTFFGTIVRDFVYLYFGYTSLSAADEIIHGLEGTSSIVTIVMAVIGLVVVGWIVYRRKFKSQSKV